MSEIKNELSEYIEEAAEEVKNLGENLTKELADTILEIQREAHSGVSAITDDAIAAERFYKSETDRIQNQKHDSDTQYLSELRENVEKIKELRDEELKCLELSHELGIIGTAEYFNQLESYRDRYFEQGSVKWLEFTSEILLHNKKIVTEQEEALADACKRTAESINEQFEAIEKKQETMEKKISSFGGIVQRNTIKDEEGDIEYFSLARLGEQNEMLEEYLRLMSEAQGRINDIWKTDTGDSELDKKNMQLRSSYFQQLRDMSITDATDFARLLTAVSNDDLIGHLGEFERRQELSDSISKALFSSEVTDTATLAGENLGQEFATALSEELSGLSDKFFASGENACQSFSDGFMSNLSTVLGELAASIDINAVALGGVGQNVENNTSYNIYGGTQAEETIRLLREKEEMKSMLLD